jgi:RHS repeat-associated protein
MMPAAKHFDMVLGVDIHLVLIPPGVPTPIPHPFIGILFDPFDYLPIFGATVFTNGLPIATAGTGGYALPPHIPLGTGFAMPPGNECTMFMGSATVLSNGEPTSFLGNPVLTCQTPAGLISPPRVKKTTKPKGFVLPTSVVLPIPAGRPVNIGGPPTISLTGLISSVAFFGAGKLAKKFGQSLKNAAKRVLTPQRMKRLSGALRKKAHALIDKLPGMSKKRAAKVKAAANKAICTLTGHPVDVASGKVYTDGVDFELPGPIPLKWERTYQSTSDYDGPLGAGWHLSYDLALVEEEDVVVVRMEDGRYAAFAKPEPAVASYSGTEKAVLRKTQTGYVLERGGLEYEFEPDAVRMADPGLRRFTLQHVRDSAGFAISFERQEGVLSQVIDSAGRCLQIVGDGHGRVQEVRGPHPSEPGETVSLVRYTYDHRGDLTAVHDALGAAQVFEYRQHLLVRETDRNGLSFYFEYDGAAHDARCTRTWGDGGIYDHKLTYDEALGITVVENSLGERTTYHHDGTLVHQEDDAFGNRSFTERDNSKQVVSEVDALGRVTSYTYDTRGNQTGVTGPDGAGIQVAYDEGDRPLRAVDQNGGEWRWRYGARGELLGRVDPLGAETRYGYRGAQLVSVIDPGGGETRLAWDVQGNLRSMTDPVGATTRWDYDALGRITAVTDPKGNVQRRTLDLLGRVVKVEEPNENVRVFAYDGEGNLVRATEANADVRFAYRGMGRLVSRTQAGATVRFEYDTEERLVGVVNQHKHRYRFELGPTGEVDAEVAFDGVTRRYVRDAAGQVVEVKRPEARWTRYKYDRAGRVTEVEHSDGTRERFEYRADGELVAAVNDDVAVRFERDPVGRILKELVGEDWVASEYDALGYRVRVQSSLGLDQRIKRNAVGDVLQVSAGAFHAEFERDVAGLEVARKLPGGVVARWERDRVGRPVKQEVQAGQVLRLGREYTWDQSDRLKQVKDAFHGTTRYEHDAWGNLSWAQFGDGAVQLRMPDAVGNLFKTEDRGDRTYGEAGQLLSAIEKNGVHTYEYDGEGNLVRQRGPDGEWRYRWNGAGMLVEVVRPDGAVVAFKYDVLARRVEKRFRGRVTRWVWDGDVPLHEWVEVAEAVETVAAVANDEERGGGRAAELSPRRAQAPPEVREGTRDAPLTWLFEPESFTPMAKLGHGQAWSVVGDQIGTPMTMLDASGRVAWSARIDAWGDLRDVVGPRGACPFRWAGQYEDTETGACYNRWRFYDSRSGAFRSVDPIGLGGGLRVHGYPGDPLGWVDPLGLSKKPCVENAAGGGGRPTYVPTGPDGRPLPLPRGPNGELAPSSMDPHTQIGWREGRRGGYVQTREFGPNGQPVKQVDWTDHGRPAQHTDPHVHDYVPNPTGGTPQHGPARPPRPGEF